MGVISNRIFLLFLLLMTSSCFFTHAVKVHQTALSQLYDKLLDGNLLVRPVWNPDDRVVVSVGFNLYQIKELNSVEQTLSVGGFISLLWYDPFMTWNETENGVKRIEVPTDKIWTPDFAIYNSADGEFRDEDWKDSNPIVHSYGYVFWSPSGLFTTSCQINILYFPFDKQACSIIINNWMHFSTEVFMTNSSSKANTKFYLPNSEWILHDTSISNHTFPGDETYPDPSVVVVTFFLERRYEGYLYTMLIPLAFVSIMGLLVFPLSVESGEKISLGVTMLLAFSVFQLIISDNLPKSSKDVPYIMLYVVALMAMNAVSVMLTVLVFHFHHKDPAPRLPKCARIFFFNFLGTITCSGSSTDEYRPERNDKAEVFRNLELVEREDGNDSDSAKCRLNGNELGPIMLDTLKELQKITKKMEADEEDDAIKGEWKKAAAILDRFFFMVGSVVLITGTVVVMFILSTQSNVNIELLY